MLVNEKEATKESIKAIKRKKRQEAFVPSPVDVSSEGIQSVELLEYPTTRVAREAGERFSNMGVSSLGTVAKLLEAGMTSKSCFESLKAFRDFAGLVSTKLNMSKITNT